MKSTKRVLWEEGTLLTPQHFQQWDRYQEASAIARLRGSRPYEWGLSSLAIDPTALAAGTVNVKACSGSFRDGFFFDSGARDPLPAPRSFTEIFDASRPHLGAYLALAEPPQSGLLCAGDDAGPGTVAPFVKGEVTISDDLREHSEQTIRTADANLRILFDGEPLNDYRTIRIAQIAKAPDGNFQIDERYVPPCVSLKVSDYLLDLLRRMVLRVGHLSGELAGKRRESGGLGEAIQYQRLLSLHARYPTLHHFQIRQVVHPELVFLELASLAAGEIAFDPRRTLEDMPTYNHERLAECFSRLEEILLQVDPVRPAPDATLIELAGRGMVRTGTVQPADLLRTAAFYLGVESDLPAERLIADLPRQAKISSPQKVQELLLANLPGLALRHSTNLPSAIRIQAGRVYFELQRAGPHWDAVEDSQQVAISLPSAFQVRGLELYAVPRRSGEGGA
jgi:type VI secretion system protein ImpJ